MRFSERFTEEMSKYESFAGHSYYLVILQAIFSLIFLKVIFLQRISMLRLLTISVAVSHCNLSCYFSSISKISRPKMGKDHRFVFCLS